MEAFAFFVYNYFPLWRSKLSVQVSAASIDRGQRQMSLIKNLGKLLGE